MNYAAQQEDVYEALDLSARLVNLQPGEHINHIWAFIMREETVLNPAQIPMPKRRRPEQLIPRERTGLWDIFLPGFYLAPVGSKPYEALARDDWMPGIVQPVVKEVYRRYIERTST